MRNGVLDHQRTGRRDAWPTLRGPDALDAWVESASSDMYRCYGGGALARGLLRAERWIRTHEHARRVGEETMSSGRVCVCV